MDGDAKRVEHLLQDAAATEFVVVTIPEEMAVAESERLVAALKRLRIPVRNLIVNHVIEQDFLCPFCQQRRTEHVGSLDRIHSLSDIFGQKIGTEITPIEGIHTLYAQEACPQAAGRFQAPVSRIH